MINKINTYGIIVPFILVLFVIRWSLFVMSFTGHSKRETEKFLCRYAKNFSVVKIIFEQKLKYYFDLAKPNINY